MILQCEADKLRRDARSVCLFCCSSMFVLPCVRETTPHTHILFCHLPPPTTPQEYAQVDPTLRGGYDFLDASLMLPGENARRPAPDIAAKASKALARAGILNATSVKVKHCSHAYALVLTVAATAAKAAAAAASAVIGGSGGYGQPGRAAWWGGGGEGDRDWKLVYSGDCRPCDELVIQGRGAGVLIHESTFDSEKAEVHCVCECVCSVCVVFDVIFCMFVSVARPG